MMPRRPKPSDTEEDLLKELSEFEGKPPQPAREEKPEDIVEPLVMSKDILERSPVVAITPSVKETSGFPSGFKVDLATTKTQPVAGKKKKSLFAQSVAKQRGQSEPNVEANRELDTDLGSESRILKNSHLLKADEISSIHQENVARVNSMTSEEIFQMRNQLLKDLKPETVEFLTKLKGQVFKPKKQHFQETQINSEEAMEIEEEGMTNSEISKEGSTKTEITETKPESALMPFQDFVHMDKPEPEKMEWAGNIVTTGSFDKSSGYSARFDFEGKLLPFVDQKVDVHTSGLHHHGEEQERPGYSINELFTLARSSNVQQKVIALNTISKIAQKYKTGCYDGLFEQNLLSELFENGIVFICRTNLDERNSNLLEAALYCLRQLVDNQWDEFLLDINYFHSWKGHIQPSLPTNIVSDKEARDEFKKTSGELKDHEVLKLDVVLGLLRMDILQRLAYILSELHPNASSIANVIHICIRIARHSLQSASKVLNHQILLNLVTKIFQSESTDPKVVFSCLKFFRVLSGWSKGFARIVLDRTNLENLIPKFMAKENGRVDVATEVLRLWDTQLQYGHLVNLYLDLFPLVMKYLLAIRGQVESTEQDAEILGSFEVSFGLIKVLNSIFCNKIEWRHVKDVFDILENILQPLLGGTYDLSQKSSLQKVKLLTCCLNAFSQALLSFTKADTVVHVHQRIQAFHEKLLNLVMKSDWINSLLGGALKFSYFLGQTMNRGRDVSNLPSLNSFAFGGDLALSAEERSPFHLLAALSSVLLVCHKIHKGLDQSVLSSFLQQDAILGYLSQITSNIRKSNKPTLTWFSTSEIIFITHLLKLDETVCILDSGLKVSVSRIMLSHLPTLLDNLTQDLFTIFLKYLHPDELSGKLGSLQLKPSDEDGNLDSVRVKEVYRPFFPPQREQTPIQVESLTERNHGESILPHDWTYLPLVNIFGRTEAGKFQLQDPHRTTVNIVLQLSYWQILTETSLTGKELALHFSRIVLVFLMSPDLFMNDTTGHFLMEILMKMLEKCRHEGPDFQHPIPGVENFKDLYSQLVEHFMAVSYGNALFSLYILVPTVFNKNLKTVLWLDHGENLRSITISDKVLPSVLKLEQFILDKEELEMLNAYARAILSKGITKKRNPLLFKIAISNLKAARDASDANCRKLSNSFFLQYEKWN